MKAKGLYRHSKRNEQGVLVKTREALLFSNMRSRCSRSYKNRNETYEHCTVSEEFANFDRFKEWCNRQIGFSCKDENGRYYQLDKDVLIKGNKIYSADTCVFVPKSINMFLCKADKIRGKFPIGMYFHKKANKFSVSVYDPFKLRPNYIGLFETQESAFSAYRERKHQYAVELANYYRHSIDERVYLTLLEYYPDIND